MRPLSVVAALTVLCGFTAACSWESVSAPDDELYRVIGTIGRAGNGTIPWGWLRAERTDEGEVALRLFTVHPCPLARAETELFRDPDSPDLIVVVPWEVRGPCDAGHRDLEGAHEFTLELPAEGRVVFAVQQDWQGRRLYRYVGLDLGTLTAGDPDRTRVEGIAADRWR